MTFRQTPLLAPPSAGRPGLWTSSLLAAAAAENPDAVAHLGLRTASPLVADALALAATGGHLLGGELSGRLADGDRTDGHFDLLRYPGPIAGLALLWSGSREDGAHNHNGAELYSWLLKQGLLPELPLHHQAAGQSLFLAERHHELRSWLPNLSRMPNDVRHYLEVDLDHPALSAEPNVERWLRSLSTMFISSGLAPLRLAPKGGTDHLFDRLATSGIVPAATAHGPLVTVVVPCWQPDEGLITSVASISGQTYADMEIVLVDDASGPGFTALFDEVAATDERIRVIRLERNGGSYLARHAAIAVTKGSLITTQDADDWSHPQRIEHQVAALMDRPDAPGSRSLAVRAKDDLTHQWFGYSALRDNASSLMVRRSVLEQVGTFLPMRKSADSEYAERLTSLVGPLADTGTPLAITRLRTGSLSRGDFSYQWHHPDRIAFRGSYRSWHRRLVGADAPRGGAPVDGSMPEVPAAFARGIEHAAVPPASLAAVLVGDLSSPPQDRPGLAPVLEELAGRPVGILHVERPRARRPGRPEMHKAWHDLTFESGDLHVVTRTHPCRVDDLVVLDPEVLLLAVAQPTVVKPTRVHLVVDERVTATAAPVDLLSCVDAARTWWSAATSWVLPPWQERDQIERALPGLAIGPWPWPASAQGVRQAGSGTGRPGQRGSDPSMTQD